MVQTTGPSILVAAFCLPASGAEIWLNSVLQSLLADGADVTYMSPHESDVATLQKLTESGLKIIKAAAGANPDGILPAYAEEIVRAGSGDVFDKIMVQGFELSLLVAESGRFSTILWSWLDDDPTSPEFLEHARTQQLESLAGGSHLLLTGSEDVRSQCESECSAVTSKMRVVSTALMSAISDTLLENGSLSLLIDWTTLSQSLLGADFHGITTEASFLRSPLRIVITGTSQADRETVAGVLRHTGLMWYPGLVIEQAGLSSTRWLNRSSVLLSAASTNSPARALVERLSHQYKLGLLDLADLGSTYAQFDDAVRTAQPVTEVSASPAGSFLQQLSHDLPDFDANPRRSSNTRVLLAGADFKFAGDLVDALVQRPDIEVKVDLFKTNAHPQPTESSQLLPWADVIITEFAAKNAIWYSHHVLPHQSLIVHLHGYELREDWIEELNIDAVTAVVVASEFYRQKAIDLRQWPAHKLQVIPNSVHPGDLVRPKLSDARFHLGMVGIVPILKRPDRALDLLERLLEIDDRYVLHIKGHAPWNYPWEWSKTAHQDAYRQFYRRIGQHPALLSHIAFEPFSPDMGNWLRKIGWLLSPSTRETFHLAAIEGATSGAVPIAWRREGSEEIIGEDFNVDSTEEAAEKILRANHDGSSYRELAILAQDFTKKYASTRVKNQWLSLVFGLADSAANRRQITGSGSSLSSRERNLFSEVTEELFHGDTDGALAVLDANIKLTAGATGPVKDLELFVRGVAAADERRFIHYLPSPPQDKPEAWRPLTIRAIGTVLRQLVLAGLDSDVVDVAPPAALASNYSPAANCSDIQPDRASVCINPEGQLRFDRWSEAVKINLEAVVRNEGYRQLIAVGPWWLAFPVSRAADTLGLSFHWVISDHKSLQLVSGDLEKRLLNNAIAQVACSVFERADRRILTDPALVTTEIPYVSIDSLLPEGDLVEAPLGLSVASTDEIAHREVTPMSSRIAEPPNALRRPLSSLRIATMAPREINQRLRKVVAEVVEVPVRGYFEAFDADIDALIIDAQAEDSGIWKGQVSSPRAEGSTPITKILDRARLLGIPSTFLYREEALVPRKFFATVRKVDQVTVSWARAIDDLFALNPSSNTTAALWRASVPFTENLSLCLRNLGIAVPAPKPRMHPDLKDEEAAPPLADFSDAERARARHMGRISLILATYGGATRIPRMLESIDHQSLPDELVELIVIENGRQDGTERLVREFARDHPEMRVHYLFEDMANAGHARNVGLEHVTGEYVTFVDDDDYLQDNYLLSMWLTAGNETLVIGALADETLGGKLITQTPNNDRIQSLSGGRLPLCNRAGLLGMNACKLIPVNYITGHRFEIDLSSGEDTVFMAGLLRHTELEVAPAAPMDDAMYVRLLRDSSLSRREVTFGFAVEDRISVINHLHRLEEDVPAGAKNALAYLADSQGSFIRDFLASNPEQLQTTQRYIATHATYPERIRLA